MTASRLVVLGLDGYEARVGDALMAERRLPNLARLKANSARFSLDHGMHKYTGLAWEHVATGLAPEVSGIWSAVHFDIETYAARHGTITKAPVFGGLACHTVVFDAPYFDLAQAGSIRGLVNWGAHDPGVRAMARPSSLSDEITARFGPYPATEHIYAFTWPDPQRTAIAGKCLAMALDQRADISRWLLCERLPDWDLALLVVSELHSVIEPMWHGWDAAHPLHGAESAAPSKQGIEAVYEALDRMIGTLTEALPDTSFVAFSMHGMGDNRADVPSMLLLPELLYRDAFGKSLFEAPPAWREASDGVPKLMPGENWDSAVKAHLGGTYKPETALNRLTKRISRKTRTLVDRIAGSDEPSKYEDADTSLDWMPAASYHHFWPSMPAFAIPSFYDGRIRINLKTREKLGLVEPDDYAAACFRLETLVRACKDTRTGEPVVEQIEIIDAGNPLGLEATQADMTIIWCGAPVGFVHPELGMIGPAPLRRTGGHTGGDGVLYISGGPLVAGDYGRRSAFDVVPTFIELMGETAPWPISGRSIVEEMPVK